MTRPDPTARPHAGHDRSLIASFAAGDLDDRATDEARALVDSCPECASLAADLGALMSAIQALPLPTRLRDFRISPEQAAAARAPGFRRLVPGWPRLGFLRPLGGALTTAGVAGLLFAVVLGGSPVSKILSNVGSAIAPTSRDYAAYSPQAANGGAGQGSGSKGEALAPSAAASAASAASAAASPASAGEDASAPGTPLPGTPPPSAAPATAPAPAPAASPAPASPQASTNGAPSGGAASGSGLPLLPAASLAAVLAGLGLLGADRLARHR